MCTILLTQVENRHSLSHVLTAFEHNTGYPFPPLSFLLGFTSVTYTLTDYDGATQYVPYLSPLHVYLQPPASPKKPSAHRTSTPLPSPAQSLSPPYSASSSPPPSLSSTPPTTRRRVQQPTVAQTARRGVWVRGSTWERYEEKGSPKSRAKA